MDHLLCPLCRVAIIYCSFAKMLIEAGSISTDRRLPSIETKSNAIDDDTYEITVCVIAIIIATQFDYDFINVCNITKKSCS